MENGHYQTFLLLTILASTIQLLLESPITSQVVFDIFATIVFACLDLRLYPYGNIMVLALIWRRWGWGWGRVLF